MAFEAVDGDGCEIVAAPAEVPGIRIGNGLRVRPFDGVTLDASRKAEWLAAHAVMHGFVALMLHHAHVIAAHEFRGRNAMLAFSLRRIRDKALGKGGRIRNEDQEGDDHGRSHAALSGSSSRKGACALSGILKNATPRS